jgi:hypothetical protein
VRDGLVWLKTPPAATRGWDFKGAEPRLLVKDQDDERGRFFLALAPS